MSNIKSNQVFNKPTWLDSEFPLLILDDFINEIEAKKLIIDGENFIKSQPQGNQIIHGGRIMIPWTSSKFNSLRNDSKYWNNFSDKFKKKAYEIFMKELQNLDNQPKITKIVIDELKESTLANLEDFKFSSKLGIFTRKFQNLLEFKIGLISPNKLLLISIIRFLDKSWRILTSLKYYLMGRKPLIPLFDYSFSSNGYGREIHRDSDNRLIVILLYLNKLDKNTNGGDLEIYKLNKNKDFPPQPNNNDCQLQYKIKPRRGRLIMFINQNNSYHGVSEMFNDKKGRHFLYGGYTYPSSIFINKKRLAKTNLPTEMYIY